MRKNRRGRLAALPLAATLAVLVVVGLTGAASADTTISMGITAADNAAAENQYRPFLDLLASRTGTGIVLKTFPDAKSLGQSASSGGIDFLILSPTDYVVLHETAGVEAIATKLNKGGTPYCQGTIVTAKGGEIKDLSDLKGKKFLFGPKGTFNKYYAAVQALKEEGIDPEKDLKTASYGAGCDGIATSILTGEADAGVVCDYSWSGWKEKQKRNPGSPQPSESLTVIGKGPRLRDAAVAASEHIDAATRESMVEALVALKDNPTILEPPLKARGFARSTDRDYDDLRKLLSNL